MSEVTINLTPSPEILEVIAEVDLQIHHCLSELIDNCLDELKQIALTDHGFEPRVDITLPVGKVTRESSIHVSDNGRGMDLAQLEAALRAGSSGKQMLGTLGMFGMGFNIATARLGSLTEVFTGRAGDPEWIVASIDIRRMIEESSYEVPIRREPKGAQESGTIVRITRLKDDIVTKLSSGRSKRDITNRLGRIYTYMLRDPKGGHSGAALMGGENIRLYVNNSPVDPLLPCIWDPERSVVYKGSTVAAATRIDHALADAFACMSCGRWFAARHEACATCGSSDIQARERRIWGWIGVQRFTDGSDFGFSFFRQGRCLVDQDKELFNWQTADGLWELEYPVEIGGGRIVGEIHLDFAKPQVRKTDFDRQSRDWHDMREIVRGLGPLRPNIAKARGYEENRSILGRYFNAFRRNDPGVKSLMPGNGRSATYDLAREWGKQFRDGDPDYLTDERWFEAAEDHDRIKAGVASAEAPAENHASETQDWLVGEGLGDLGTGSPANETAASASSSSRPAIVPRAETDDERFARYRESATLLPETNREIRIDSVKTVLRVYATTGVALVADGRKRQFVVRLPDGEVEIYVDEDGPLIRDFGWTTIDTALMCAAPHLREIYRYDGSADELVRDLLAQFPDRRVDASAVRSRADGMLEAIRDRLAVAVAKDPQGYWEALGPEAKQAAENYAVGVANDIDWPACVTSGDFARYIGATAVSDLISRRPDFVFDGKLFRSSFDSLGGDARSDQVARLSGLVADLRRMVAGPATVRTLELQRYLLSADLLEGEIVDQ